MKPKMFDLVRINDTIQDSFYLYYPKGIFGIIIKVYEKVNFYDIFTIKYGKICGYHLTHFELIKKSQEALLKKWKEQVSNQKVISSTGIIHALKEALYIPITGEGIYYQTLCNSNKTTTLKLTAKPVTCKRCLSLLKKDKKLFLFIFNNNMNNYTNKRFSFVASDEKEAKEYAKEFADKYNKEIKDFQFLNYGISFEGANPKKVEIKVGYLDF